MAGCGGAGDGSSHSPSARVRPAFGLTEDNAQLLGGAPSGGEPQAVTQARRELAGLRPRYVRLLVDWAALQPDPTRPPALEVTVAGCARTTEPCLGYDGVAAELSAIASRQRSEKGDYQVLVDILGMPAWAAAPAHGCDDAGVRGADAQTLKPSALPAYEALIADLLALGRREGVRLAYWSPWNEPNNPGFLAPQRAACQATASVLAPGAYVTLASAMAGQLARDGGGGQLVLGELAAYATPSPHRTTVAEFISAIPRALLCSASVISLHAYASWDTGETPGAEPVAALEHVLASADGGCAHAKPIWITETGAGAPHPGGHRSGSTVEELEGCRALAARLAEWSTEPAVAAIFQYTFREDPSYPVGLVSADLEHRYPTYGLWRRFEQATPAAALGDACQ
ncbi:MAG TPA: hypothetical protein VGG08_07920 [Solirubrobacteraceae bacterium]|jgi:hypothetical protein